jgi:copper oxidase (laccase) domain-containing protein
MEAGVARVHDAGVCTICSDPDLLFSYRRDGAATGRQAAIAWLS